MKIKIIACLLAILLVASWMAGCTKKECESHVDENKDGKCDVCEAALICSSHTDEDGNLTCDVCGLAITPICDLHMDADKNLVCDVCGAALTATCDPHKDANADRICDMCGGAIVVITEYIAPKEEVRVEPVVNPIPSGVALGEYFKTSPTGALLTSGAKVEHDDPDLQRSNYLYYDTPSEDGTMITYVIVDLATGEERLRQVKPAAEFFEVNLYADFYLIRTVNENGEYVYSYYSYAGVLFSSQIVESGGTPYDIHEDYLAIPGHVRVELGDRYYVLNYDTDEYLFSLDKKTYVSRPRFDMVRENYGYVQMENTVYVYDLSAWLSCAVSYEIPSYYENVSWFVLENGNILLQAEVRLGDRAVSYDFLRTDGEVTRKYDLVYMMMDPVAKTVSAVEFGYRIASVRQPEGEGLFTEKALNLMWVEPIVNDRIDSNAARELIVDNALTVLLDCGEILQATDGTDGISVVGSNLFLLRIRYKNGVVRRVVNEKGEHVVYLPETAVDRHGYVEYDGKFYTYGMELILDPVAEGYGAPESLLRGAYRLLTRENEGVTEYYFFNGSAPVKLDLEGVSLGLVHELGFALRGTVGGEVVCRFYNTDGTHILDTAAEGIALTVLEEGYSVYVLTDSSGARYLLK